MVVQALEQAIGDATGEAFHCENSSAVGGGCINDAFVLTGGGRDFFAFSTGGGRDRVLDYRDGQDRFMIENGASDFAGLAIIDLGDDALIRFSNVRIIVEDTDHLILDASDFLFG